MAALRRILLLCQVVDKEAYKERLTPPRVMQIVEPGQAGLGTQTVPQNMIAFSKSTRAG